jgi:catechol 2,3-dioxygenase-like lactoylglutathione lyase family enzyme
MIIAAHAVVFAEDAEQARAFFRDVLDLPNVDAGGGWLIFACRPPNLPSTPASPPTPAAIPSTWCATTSTPRSRNSRPRA